MNTDRKVNPTLADLLIDVSENIFDRINCVKVGKIQSIDFTTNSCSVQINFKKQISDTQIRSFPLLLEVPILLLQGGGSWIEFPITSGDNCLVLFNDRDISTMWTTGQIALPPTTRKHDLSDGFALVGFNTKQNPLSLLGTCLRLFGGSKKIEFQNNSLAFSVWLGDFIDAITNLVTVGSPTSQALSASTITTLDNLKTQALTLFGSS